MNAASSTFAQLFAFKSFPFFCFFYLFSQLIKKGRIIHGFVKRKLTNIFILVFPLFLQIFFYSILMFFVFLYIFSYCFCFSFRSYYTFFFVAYMYITSIYWKICNISSYFCISFSLHSSPTILLRLTIRTLLFVFVVTSSMQEAYIHMYLCFASKLILFIYKYIYF